MDLFRAISGLYNYCFNQNVAKVSGNGKKVAAKSDRKESNSAQGLQDSVIISSEAGKNSDHKVGSVREMISEGASFIEKAVNKGVSKGASIIEKVVSDAPDIIKDAAPQWVKDVYHNIINYAKAIDAYQALAPEEKIAIKEKTEEVVKALNSNKKTPQEKNSIADTLTEIYGATKMLSPAQVEKIKSMSLQEKMNIIAELSQLMEKCNSSQALLTIRTNIVKVEDTLTSDEKKNVNVQSVEIQVDVISNEKVNEFTKGDSSKKDDPNIAQEGLNGVNSDVVILAKVHQMDVKDAAEINLPQELVKSIDQSGEALKALASDVIKIAEAKGYQLDNLPQLAAIANGSFMAAEEAGTAEQSISATPIEIVYSPNGYYVLKDTATPAVLQMIEKNNKENKIAEDKVYEKSLQRIAEEKDADKKHQLKIDAERKFAVRKLENPETPEDIKKAIAWANFLHLKT